MQLAKHATALVIRLVVASLLLVLVRGLSAAASDGVTDVYSDSRQTIFSGYYTGTAITASGGQTQMTKINDILQLREYKYPEFDEIPSNASLDEWSSFQSTWIGQKFFIQSANPAGQDKWAPNLMTLGRPVSCIATATSTIGLVAREGGTFRSIGYDSIGPDIEFLPLVVSATTYVPIETGMQHALKLGDQWSSWSVVIPWTGRLNLSPTPAVFAPNQGAAFGILYDPLTRLPIVATPSYVKGLNSQIGTSLGTLPIRDETTYSPTLALTGSLSPWNSGNTTLDQWYGALGSWVSGETYWWTHVAALSSRLTISSTTTYSDQPNYDRDISFVDGRVAWTSEEEFSHIIHASNLSVSGSTLVVANSAALGEALLTSDSRAAYEVWLSTESWAVQNDGFYNSGNDSIYLESPGGAKIRDGSILNEGLIRFRCPLASGSSTAFEPSRTLKVFSGASILSGTQEGSGGYIRAENGGFLDVRGEVTQSSVSGFEGVAVTAGGLLSGPQHLVTGELRVSGNSDLIVGGYGLYSNDIRVTDAGTLSVSGVVSSGALTISGSASRVECERLDSVTLALEDGSNFLLRSTDDIFIAQISDRATLTTSGSSVTLQSLSNNGGSVVLGGDLDVTGWLSVDSGAFNAGGHAISADSVSASGDSSFTNLASVTTYWLDLNRGVSFATPRSGSIGSASVSGSATLMISGGSTTIGALFINGGNAVLGEDLDVEHYVALEAGTIDAGGNRISANSITLGSWEGSWSVTNLGRVVTPNLLIMNGSVMLNGGVVDSITTIAASIDLRMDASSAFTADSAILLSGLSISPGGTLRLSSFDEYEGMDMVGLRWSGGDHSAVLSGYLQDGRIAYRPGLGNVRAVYDVDSDSTLIIDPYAVNAFDVETNVEMYASGTASIVGNTTVRKTGNGTLLLTGSNSYYAGTTIDAGKVVAGSVHAFGMGEVVVNGGTLDLASMPVANPTTIVSGSIANAENYEGSLNLAGTVSLTGTVGGLVSVDANGELKGSNTTFTGPVSIESEGQHSPGSSPGTQTFEDGLSYAAGSMLNWELIANTVAGAGTTYDFLSLTGGSLLVEDGAIMNLAFSGNGSTVNWDSGFWDAEHSWIVIDALAAIDSTGTFTLGIIGDDSLGQPLLSVRPTAGFAIENTAESIVLSYSPVAVPEPSTYAMALAGLACGGYSMWRRRKDAA